MAPMRITLRQRADEWKKYGRMLDRAAILRGFEQFIGAQTPHCLEQFNYTHHVLRSSSLIDRPSFGPAPERLDLEVK